MEFSEGGPACCKAPQVTLPHQGSPEGNQSKEQDGFVHQGSVYRRQVAYGPSTGMVAYSREELRREFLTHYYGMSVEGNPDSFSSELAVAVGGAVAR